MSHLLTKQLSSSTTGAFHIYRFLSRIQLPLSLSFAERRHLSMGSSSSDSQNIQNIVVIRHGDRLDNYEPLWVTSAARPWDPPLADPGKVRAFCTGRRLRSKLGFPIHRVFVSPFLRCIQTASEVISALCAIEDDPVNMTSEGVAIDPSKLKVSVEFGLCEMMSREAIRLELAPKDGNWGFNLSELEAMLPAGTVDPTVQRVYQELPRYEEGVKGSRTRYEKIIQTLADKYPSENLLLVTHGEGVGVSVSAFMDTTVYEVDYCAFSHLRRPVFFGENQSFTAGNFVVLTKHGQTGISYDSTLATTF